MSICRRLALILPVVAALGLTACGDGVVLPDEGAPAAIIVVSGDEQTGPAGAALPQALVVRVSDSQNRPVANQTVGFAIDAGGGQVTPASAATNSDGLASTTWTLGPGAGQQRVRAQATGNGAPANLAVSFTASALSGSAGRLELVSGDAQVGSVGTALAEPLVVRVTDALGNPVGGVTVGWSVSGGGSIDPVSTESGPDGLVQAERVLGPTAGTQSAQAAVDGLEGSPVTFTHTADASVPTSLIRVSGDDQTAPAGFQLPDSLVVRLIDDNGNGVGGRTVTWVVPVGGEAGVVAPVNSTTNVDGYAFTRWTLGTTVGSFTLSAVFSGLPSVPFTATATPDAPTTLALVSGDGQVGTVGTNLPAPLRVKVTDANGNGVENVSITWTAVDGGSVSSTTTGTDAQGIAQVNRTLGATPGTYTTTAEVAGLAGSPLTFSATANVGPAARLAWIVQPADAVVGQTLPPMQVEVRDAQGNRVTGASNVITITAPAAAGLDGDDDENASAGVATFDALRLTRAGSFQLTARASGLTNDVSRSVTIAKGETSIAIVNRSPTTTVVGQQVIISYQVSVSAPASGNPGGTVTVSDGSQSCNGGVSSGSGSGSCQIPFTSAGTHTISARYNGDANFNGSTSASQDHTVNKANATITITSDDPDPSSVGQAVTVAYTVTNAQAGAGTPSGNVTITDGAASATCTVADGECDIALTTPGNRTLTATYAGDANFNGDDDTETHEVRQPTTTAVSTSDGTTVFGENVTFTATVTGSGGTPQGSVQFRADGQAIGGAVTLSGGTASRSTNQLAVGSHVITADYTPSGTTFGSSTGTLSPNQQVAKASTTTAINNVAPEPSNPGQPYTVSVTVSPVAPGGGTPDGTVAISDGQGGSCTATLDGGGSGNCQLSSATPGDKTITATYNGSASYDGGSSDTAPHNVNTPPTANDDEFSGGPLPFGSFPPGVLANDSDANGDSFSAVPQLDSEPSNGAVSLSANGGFIYTPNVGFQGDDSFTYHIVDEHGANSNTATVTLHVGP